MTPTPAVSAKEKAREALRMFVERITANGEWDDGCFYFHGTSASELQEPLRLAQAALREVVPVGPAVQDETEALATKLRAIDDSSDLYGLDADTVAIAADALLRLQRETDIHNGYRRIAEAKLAVAEGRVEQLRSLLKSKAADAYTSPSPPSAPAGVKELISDLAAVVHIQNGNHHADINALLARAEDALSSLQPDTQAAAASAPAGDIQELASASVRPEPSDGVEIVHLYRWRVKDPTQKDIQWSAWFGCKPPDPSDDIELEFRTLYATAPAPLPREDSKATLADANSITSAPAQEGRADG